MPTKNRRRYLPLALRNFASQTYQHKELVIADDGEQSMADLCQGVPNVRYLRLNHPVSIGAKRNLLCEATRGEVIAFMDDDDYYAPKYVEHHLETLQRNGLVLTGMYEAPFVNRDTRQAFIFRNHVRYAIGATLCFLKRHWISHPFVDVTLGEDYFFQESVPREQKRFTSHHGLFIATDHEATGDEQANTSPRNYAMADCFDGSELLKIVGDLAPRTQSNSS